MYKWNVCMYVYVQYMYSILLYVYIYFNYANNKTLSLFM